jgi:hypothetical protein
LVRPEGSKSRYLKLINLRRIKTICLAVMMAAFVALTAAYTLLFTLLGWKILEFGILRFYAVVVLLIASRFLTESRLLDELLRAWRLRSRAANVHMTQGAKAAISLAFVSVAHPDVHISAHLQFWAVGLMLTQCLAVGFLTFGMPLPSMLACTTVAVVPAYLWQSPYCAPVLAILLATTTLTDGGVFVLSFVMGHLTGERQGSCCAQPCCRRVQQWMPPALVERWLTKRGRRQRDKEHYERIWGLGTTDHRPGRSPLPEVVVQS